MTENRGTNGQTETKQQQNNEQEWRNIIHGKEKDKKDRQNTWKQMKDGGKTVEKKDGTSDMGKRKDERNIIGRNETRKTNVRRRKNS